MNVSQRIHVRIIYRFYQSTCRHRYTLGPCHFQVVHHSLDSIWTGSGDGYEKWMKCVQSQINIVKHDQNVMPALPIDLSSSIYPRTYPYSVTQSLYMWMWLGKRRWIWKMIETSSKSNQHSQTWSECDASFTNRLVVIDIPREHSLFSH
jgi:hypothetical protein